MRYFITVLLILCSSLHGDKDNTLAELKEKLAISLEAQGRIKEASRTYEELIRVKPLPKSIILNYIRFQHRNRKYDKAAEALRRFRYPSSAVKVLKGINAFYRKDYEASFSILKHLNLKDSKDLWIFVQTAVKTGNRDIAIETIEKLLRKSRAEDIYLKTLAQLLIEKREYDRALSSAEQIESKSNKLLYTAMAASGAMYLKTAIRNLELLKKTNAFQPGHHIWLGNLYRRDRQIKKALKEYITYQNRYPKLITDNQKETIGDLHFELKDYKSASDQWSTLSEKYKKNNSAIFLKLARSYQKFTEHTKADQSYRSYLAINSLATEVLDEVINYHMAGKRFIKALEYIRLKPGFNQAPSLIMQRAKLHLWLQNYKKTEELALILVKRRYMPLESGLLYGEAIHQAGKNVKALNFLSDLEKSYPESEQLLLLIGKTAKALDLHIPAYNNFRRYNELVTDESNEETAFELESALRNNLFHETRNRLDGLKPEQFKFSKLEQIKDRTDYHLSSHGGLRLFNFTDKGDLNIKGFRVHAGLPFKPNMFNQFSFRLSRMKQKGTEINNSGLEWKIDKWQLNSRNSFESELTLNRFRTEGKNSYLLDLKLTYTHKFQRNSKAEITLFKESFLNNHYMRSPRQYSGITSLADTAPSLSLKGFVLSYEHSFTPYNRYFRISGSYEDFSDNNRKLWIYTHYQFPLFDTPDFWMALKPNFYAETFKNRVSNYFSPSSHYTAGFLFHSIIRSEKIYFESEINPLIVRTDGVNGWGFHLMGKLSYRFKAGEIGLGLFYYYNKTGSIVYWLWNGVLNVRINL